MNSAPSNWEIGDGGGEGGTKYRQEEGQGLSLFLSQVLPYLVSSSPLKGRGDGNKNTH